MSIVACIKTPPGAALLRMPPLLPSWRDIPAHKQTALSCRRAARVGYISGRPRQCAAPGLYWLLWHGALPVAAHLCCSPVYIAWDMCWAAAA